MRFSYGMVPIAPVGQLVDSIELADELGFYACYSADETYEKDLWQIFAIAAARARRIRMSPEVTHVILKEPTIIAQQVATLDEITAGRAEVVFSIGNIAMLEQYNINWRAMRPMARLREAHHVIRTFLDEGRIDFEGEFFKYTGLFTAARPTQQRVPVKIGAMGGPLSFEVAGEISDGMHTAWCYSQEALRYAADHVKIGADRAGRDWRDLDLGNWVGGAISTDVAANQNVARLFGAFSISATPRQLLERNGVEYESVRPVVEALAANDIDRAVELTAPEVAAKLCIAGTPEEWIAKIRDDFIPNGFTHIIFGLVDPDTLEQFTGRTIANLPSLNEQLRLIHDRVMPAFA
jgi:5,10-methylenetetrahydromethanopterin reductase